MFSIRYLVEGFEEAGKLSFSVREGFLKIMMKRP